MNNKVNGLGNQKVSFLSNFFDNEPHLRSLKEVTELAQSDDMKRLTDEIRHLHAIANDENTPANVAMNAKNNRQKLKQNLYSFLTDVVCEHGKKREHIVRFLPLLGFDVDHLDSSAVETLVNQLVQNEHVVFAQPSCSRLGVHFILYTDTDGWLNSLWDGKNVKPYEFVWNAARDYVEKIFGIVVDKKCCNPEHILAINADVWTHFNENATPLHIDTHGFVEPQKKVVSRVAKNSRPTETHHASINDVADQIILHLESEGHFFAEGSRNDFLYRFASACNKYGVGQWEVEEFCSSNFSDHGFTEKEMNTTIGSAYKNANEHGTWSTRATCATCAGAHENAQGVVENTQKGCSGEEKGQEMIFTQTFSDQIPYEDFCGTLRTVYDSMDDPEGRDKMLLATILLLSGMLPNVYGLYGGHKVYANLFLILFGLTASRKGEISCCGNLVAPLKEKILNAYNEAYRDYKTAHATWESMGAKSAQRAERGDEPTEPVYRSPIIPANSSATATYMAINDNGGWGIIFETEAATVSQSLLSDYGDYSTGLLQAFHHEPIRLNRMKDKIHVDIEEPKISVGLTCTPGQLPKLFPSFENGLGNRFLFYGLNRHLEWINPFKKIEKPLDELYRDLGQDCLELFEELQKLPEPGIQFQLTSEQETKFNDTFSGVLQEQFSMLGDGISPFIFRMGLCTFRIAMVLTLERIYAEWDKSQPLFSENEKSIKCHDKDFNIAMTIMNVLLNHTAYIYSSLAKEEDNALSKPLGRLSNPERNLFQALPDEFTTSVVSETAISLGINPDTARRYIGNFVNKHNIAIRVKLGVYQKSQK